MLEGLAAAAPDFGPRLRRGRARARVAPLQHVLAVDDVHVLLALGHLEAERFSAGVAAVEGLDGHLGGGRRGEGARPSRRRRCHQSGTGGA